MTTGVINKIIIVKERVFINVVSRWKLSTSTRLANIFSVLPLRILNKILGLFRVF